MSDQPIIVTKQCSKCKETKTLNEENFAVYNGKWRSECRPCGRAMSRAWKANNPTKNKAITNAWRVNNKDHIREYNTAYDRNRKIVDPIFKLTSDIRTKMCHLVISIVKENFDIPIRLLECETDFFADWLSYQFKQDMNWDNYGSEWTLDHVWPCAKFNLNDENNKKVCFHWWNYRPLYKQSNRAKGDYFDIELIWDHYEKADGYLDNYVNNHDYVINADLFSPNFLVHALRNNNLL